MGNNLSKEIMKLSVVVLAIASALPAIEQDQASSILSRHARAIDKRGFEEVKSGNLERECIEETCDQHELFEDYDDENAPEILKYNQCNLFVNELQKTLENAGQMVTEDLKRDTLRVCATKSKEELITQLRDEARAGIQKYWHAFKGKLNNLFN